MSMNKNTVIFDLDGTLADINERKQKAFVLSFKSLQS